MAEEEEWIRTAMSDDSVVVEMLLRLHQARPPTPLPTRKRGTATVLQLEWSVRQRRSKQVPRKKGDMTRASPTTPLCWSGATSVSGGGAADVSFEESSKPTKKIDKARSKVVATGETTTTKRSRKKKTLAELKEEESLQLKERRILKNKLAALRLSLEKKRAENESLKRMKLDILSQQSMEMVRASASEEAIPTQPYPSCMILTSNCASNEVKPSTPLGSSKLQEGGSKGTSFLLPDLNLPFDNDSGFRNLHGVS